MAYDPGNPREVRGEDNKTLEELAAAHGALLRALQAMPNSVHTAFELPRDYQEIERCLSTLTLIMSGVETRHRETDSTDEATRA